MLKIEFVEYKEDSKSRYTIRVNSKEDKNSYWIHDNGKSGKKYNIGGFYNYEIINELISYSFQEVGEFLYEVNYEGEIENWEFRVDMEIICKNDKSIYEPKIKVKLQFGWEEWDKPYSFLKFSEVFSQIIQSEVDSTFYYFQEDEDTIVNGIGIIFDVGDIRLKISDEENRVVEITEEIIQKTHQTLLANLDKDLITSYFTFPEEIKAACKQYLVYFAQFLMDLGIEADTEIKEEAQQTLFKVIPKNKEESLDKIREALDVYLNIPKDFDIQVAQNNDVVVMQWQANVKHLEGQIMLAKAAMQMKDATIETLQLSNYQYKSILEQKNLEKEPKNEEEIAGGLVKVKEYDGDGFSINLPEILRRLRRKFK